MASTKKLDAVVVGASWAGLWLLYLLKKSGFTVRLLDAVDTEVPFYEFSLPELWKNWKWSEKFPSRAEIRDYLYWVCQKLNIYEDIDFGTRITAAHWDEQAGHWRIFSGQSLLAETTYFVPCTGYTTIKHVPAFPGLESFPLAYHSSEWPENLSVTGLRVGVVGTGASGIQIIENVAPDVKKLVVFQRTPNMATPLRQEVLNDDLRGEMKTRYPALFDQRVSRFGFNADIPTKKTFDDNAEQREAFYQRLFDRGGLHFWLANYDDLLSSREANQEAYRFWAKSVRDRVRDPGVAAKLAPLQAPHAFGTKRPSLETAYFERFNQDNVVLVDVNEYPIVEVLPNGVRTSEDFHRLDVLILATGFDAIVGSMLTMDIRGIGGRHLREKWMLSDDSAGIHTSFGLMTEGFPNMFFPIGPQAPSALGLTPQMAEIQGKWIVDCLTWLRLENKEVIEPDHEAEEVWKAENDRAAKRTLFGETDSWYMGANIQGRKKQPLCYLGGVNRYIDFLKEVAAQGYPGFKVR
ncbi:hypothetical protein LTS17_012897 [Exophiala oligosperma]